VIEGEGSGEESGEEIEGEESGPVGLAGPVGSPVGSPVGPVGSLAGPASPGGPVGPVGPALAPAPIIGSPDAGGSAGSTVPAISILPATPVKNQGKSNQEDMLVDGPDELDPDSPMMGGNEDLGYSLNLKRGRERSGTGEARVTKTHRRSASHSTAPTVPSTEAEDDELDPHGSSRTIGGFIRGRAAGNNYNWGDANDATSMDSADQDAPTYGKVLVFVDRKSGSSPYMSFTTEATSELPVVLKEMSGRFSPIERRDSRIYVFEDEVWEVKGRFSQAIKDNAPLHWNMNDDGKLLLYLLAVGVFFYIIHIDNLKIFSG
jgi:hypothetical protein